ncbi:MAG TPA: response regulator [Verrucomicrobiae bacterium]|nr:response regulator [Verrucomicrobiae bacterium]
MEQIKVFIVEDDPMVASINQRLTEKVTPFSVVGTGTTEAGALNQIETLNPDLVLLDIFLPQGNGLELLKQIRNRNIPTDIIVVTAAKDTNTIYETLRYGAVDYLIKPFDFERLQLALRNYLRLRQLMGKDKTLNQAELDKLNFMPEESNPVSGWLPKGVHTITLEQIISYLIKQSQPVSCLDLASALSISKITVWRYLEYLISKEKVEVELEYGTKGRPTKLYRVVS